MKQIIILLLLLLTMPAFSQVKLSGLTTMYSGNPTDEAPVIAVATSSGNTVYQNTGREHEVSFDKINLRGVNNENITVGQVFDTSGAHFFVISKTGSKIKQFEYRIREDSSFIVPWTSVLSGTEPSGTGNTMNYLGNFKAKRGSYLWIDLRRKGAEHPVASAVVVFRAIQPTLSNIYLADETKLFMKRIAKPNEEEDSSQRKKWELNYKPHELDEISGLPKKLVLEPHQNSVIFYLKELISKAELLEYQLLRNGEVHTDWKPNDFDNGFIWLSGLPTGNYELRLRFRIQRENVTAYPFIIKPRWDQTLTFKLLGGSLIAAFFGFLLLLYRLRRQRQKLRRTKAERDKALAELRSIYSQLNPHFIFNALSSIQGLVNRNETEKVNHYLSTFSKLLRESLVNSEKDTVPLSTELHTLETYMQLEQLRFNFRYVIEVDERIHAAEVEVPYLFLQPLVENAIKHGVSSMYANGNVDIRFNREGNDMVASITDNGKGFDPAVATKGFGLKLTRERARLLNEADKDRSVRLSIPPGMEEGTTILVRFKNWL